MRVGICAPSFEAQFIGRHRRRASRRTARVSGCRTGRGPDEPPYLTLAPPALDDPEVVPDARRFREEEPAPAPLPDWWNGAGEPLVYLTLGSVAGSMGFFPGVYRAAIDALAPLGVRVLVTTGRDADPAELGPLPANVHAERWVAQADVMPHASVMVCHGGFGTVRAGLAAGVPLAVLPLFADQPYNAERVQALGAGLALRRARATGSRTRRARALLAASRPTPSRAPWTVAAGTTRELRRAAGRRRTVPGHSASMRDA